MLLRAQLRSRIRLAQRVAGALALLVTLGASHARAEQSTSARADALFQDGKAHLAQSDFAQACPLFAQSFEAEAATGTLLALAICHERAGKLASAFHEYQAVAGRSQHEARVDREKAARAKAAELEPKLSTLKLVVTDDPHAVQLQIDGVLIEPALLAAPIALDGGAHHIEALIDAKPHWSADLSLSDSSDAKTVNVPALLTPSVVAAAPIVVLEAPSTPAPAPKPRRETHATATGLSTGQWAGLATLGAAAVSCGLGTVFAIVATHDNDASKAGCDGDLCTDAGRARRLDARHAGDASTASFMLAGAATTVGAVLFFATGRAESSEQASYSLTPWAAAHAAGADVHGAF